MRTIAEPGRYNAPAPFTTIPVQEERPWPVVSILPAKDSDRSPSCIIQEGCAMGRAGYAGATVEPSRKPPQSISQMATQEVAAASKEELEVTGSALTE